MTGWGRGIGAICAAVLILSFGVNAPVLAHAWGNRVRQGAQKRWGAARYGIPAGWSDSLSGNVRTFTPPGADKDLAAILLVQGPPVQGDFRAAFDRAVGVLTTDKKVVNKTSVDASHTSEGFDVLSQVVVTEEKGGGGRTLIQLVAIHAPDHLWLCGFVGKSAEVCQKYNPTLQKFLANLDFDTASGSTPGRAADDTPAAPAPAGRPWTPDAAAITRSEATRRAPGRVRGKVYDAQGRALRLTGVQPHIHVFGKSAEGQSVTADGYADENGNYDFKVPHGLYIVRCFITVSVGGNPIQVELDQLDDRPTNIVDDSTPGIVKDFGLKLSGPVKGQRADSFAGYHGGGVYVTDGANWKDSYFGSMLRKYPQGTKVMVTLTPRSNLIDGSQARPFTFECRLENMQTGATQANIPLAVYQVTAKLVLPDGRQQPLKVALLPNLQYADAAVINFAPDRGDPDHKPTVPNIFVLD